MRVFNALREINSIPEIVARWKRQIDQQHCRKYDPGRDFFAFVHAADGRSTANCLGASRNAVVNTDEVNAEPRQAGGL